MQTTISGGRLTALPRCKNPHSLPSVSMRMGLQLVALSVIHQ